ncbi:hypothetical protein [Kordia sp.]|uniref:hypothetical protein n=1 Tax=Kordia sp. TaxID=1965332 RepID=UPI003D6BC9FB
MRILLIILIISFFSSCKTNKQSFTGSIKFSTQFLPPKKPSKDLTILREMYGDSLLMVYQKNGDYIRKYLNNIDPNIYLQSFDAAIGKVYYKNKKLEVTDSVDVTVNGVELISVKKIDNELIMGYDCDCYEYIAFFSMINQDIILNFCYSSETPYLNPKLYKKHVDFFISDFFEKSNRPYLKFSTETEEFKAIYTATSINTN